MTETMLRDWRAPLSPICGLCSTLTANGVPRAVSPYNEGFRRCPYTRKTGIPKEIHNASNNEIYGKFPEEIFRLASFIFLQDLSMSPEMNEVLSDIKKANHSKNIIFFISFYYFNN